MEHGNTHVCRAERVQELPGFPAASAWKHFSRNHGSAEKLSGGSEHLFEYLCPSLWFPAGSFREGCWKEATPPLGWLLIG